jgi:hypothetical protein
VDGEADDEKSGKGCFAGGNRRTDGQAFAEIVKADPKGDESGELQAFRRCAMPAADGEQQGASNECRNPHRGLGAEPIDGRGGGLQTFTESVDQQIDEESHGQCKDETNPLRRKAAKTGIGKKAGGDGSYSQEQADEGEHGQGRHFITRGLLGHADLMLEDGAGAGEEGDVVGFTADPGIGDVDPDLAEPSDRTFGVLGKLAIGAVDLHLGDMNGARAVGADRKADQVRRQTS